jgi:hypothetical protein
MNWSPEAMSVGILRAIRLRDLRDRIPADLLRIMGGVTPPARSPSLSPGSEGEAAV